MSYVILGRAPDCHVVLDSSSVSSRHARMSWRGGLVLVEDLASANGTWTAGRRVQRVLVRPGDEVLLGREAVPWTHEKMRAFLRLGAGGTRVLPETPRWKTALRWLGYGTLGLAGVLGAAVLLMLPFPAGRQWLRDASDKIAAAFRSLRLPQSDQEAYVRKHMAPNVRDAIDPDDSIVRNAAVKIASKKQGVFSVEQIAEIWLHVRTKWKYVNDPRGREYFAKARETIANNYAGDCDDFAITLAAMLGAIGGDARVVFMEGPDGGHAYAEVCIQADPSKLAKEMAQYYATAWKSYVKKQPKQIAYRSSPDCPVWLNLDWFSDVPGGDYRAEQWAVAVLPNGETETLAPAKAPTVAATR